MSTPSPPIVLFVEPEESVNQAILDRLYPFIHESTFAHDDQAFACHSTSSFDDAPTQGHRVNSRLREAPYPTFKVQFCNRGEEALRFIEESTSGGRPVAVALISLHLKDLSGLEIAQKIQELDKRTEIRFISSFKRDIDTSSSTSHYLTTREYLVKPFTAQELTTVVFNALHDWKKFDDIKSLIEEVTIPKAPDRNLEAIVGIILERVTRWSSARGAYLIRCGSHAPIILGCHPFQTPHNIDLSSISHLLSTNGTHSLDGMLIFSLGEYALILIGTHPGLIPSNWYYLIQLFLQHTQKALETERLTEQLHQAERLSSIGEAVSRIVHDLRSPLAVIRGALELTESKQNDSALRAEMHSLIAESTKESLFYLQDILDFAKGTEIQRGSVALAPFFERLRKKWHVTKSQCTINVDADINDSFFQCDELRLERALTNLVSNAVTALERSDVLLPHISIRARRESEYLNIDVHDNGPGIQDDIIDTLFDPFVSRNTRNGTGLGLAIAKQLIEAHGGILKVTSSPQGTCFHLSLPSINE
jgi:two-component system, NtrC family, sensor kinase